MMTGGAIGGSAMRVLPVVCAQARALGHGDCGDVMGRADGACTIEACFTIGQKGR
jgi:hypothetical protein